MLNSGNQIESTGSACKPDPEDMLQRARKSLEKENDNLSKFKEFINAVGYLERDNELAARNILGELSLKVMQAEENEQRWLDEIDK